MSKWLIRRGIEKKIAEKYITSLFNALSSDAYKNSSKNLNMLVKNSQTPKGLNEHNLKLLRKKKIYKSISKSLDLIHKRLKNAK